ncbi:MAG: phosphohydrolase [Acidiferrobacteraceae bacterium]|nr:phosphohydrolase [Acidiferrobacteraceae bacterium]|tara:strand:- start:288 stop:848 length:561 start_codon:yes stop_codon:yes gene_type:complete
MAVARAKYISMDMSTAEDWQKYRANEGDRRRAQALRLTAMLKDLRHADDTAPIDTFSHSLQSATLAYRDGRDDETVFMTLFHDIGTLVSDDAHADVSAAILKPYLSEKNYWIVKHHGIFQGYYYFQYFDENRNMRDEYSHSPHYDECIAWCDKYDQRAFSSQYISKPLDFFQPLIDKILLGGFDRI